MIEEIRKLSGGRYLVILKDGRRFPLYKKDIDDLRLREGTEISEETLSRIYGSLLPERGRLRAMHLLEQMDRTEYQLRQKLQQSSYPQEIIDDAIAYVKSYHYIDDLRYASCYLRDHAAGRSIRLMQQELYQKGVDKATVEQALEESREQEDFPDEEDQIRSLLVKKHYDAAASDPKERQRIYAFLARRGYSASAIHRVMQLSGDEGSDS